MTRGGRGNSLGWQGGGGEVGARGNPAQEEASPRRTGWSGQGLTVELRHGKVISSDSYARTRSESCHRLLARWGEGAANGGDGNVAIPTRGCNPYARKAHKSQMRDVAAIEHSIVGRGQPVSGRYIGFIPGFNLHQHHTPHTCAVLRYAVS